LCVIGASFAYDSSSQNIGAPLFVRNCWSSHPISPDDDEVPTSVKGSSYTTRGCSDGSFRRERGKGPLLYCSQAHFPFKIYTPSRKAFTIPQAVLPNIQEKQIPLPKLSASAYLI
ncbi:hypothetical protein CEXT_760801, partial [Caerostris extrusa]